MALKILHGGMIRYSVKVAAANTTQYAKGRVLTLNSSGEAVLSTAGVADIVGLAVEDRVPTTQYSPTATSQAGRPSGEYVALLLDEAVVEDDQISGNTVFAVNGAVYIDDAGRLTDQNTRNRVIGRVLVANSVGGSVRMMYSVQY